tara:strand:- start:656 stop:781 length:126 start_codon:yes stop_codon:yes gene_type:complete
MSGAHYVIEEETKEVKPKPSLVCSYSGLPSVISYSYEKNKT